MANVILDYSRGFMVESDDICDPDYPMLDVALLVYNNADVVTDTMWTVANRTHKSIKEANSLLRDRVHELFNGRVRNSDCETCLFASVGNKVTCVGKVSPNGAQVIMTIDGTI